MMRKFKTWIKTDKVGSTSETEMTFDADESIEDIEKAIFKNLLEVSVDWGYEEITN